MFYHLQRHLNRAFIRNVLPKTSVLSAIAKRQYASKPIATLVDELLAQRKPESPIKNIETIVEQIDHELVDSFLALKILQCCRDTINETQKNIFQFVWTKLNEKKCDLRATHYAVAMQFYQRVKDPPGVLNIFKGLEKANVEPSPMIYQILINTFVHESNLKKVKEWMIRMEEAGFHLNEKTLHDILFCCLKNGDVETASQLFDKMKMKNFDINYPRFHRFPLSLLNSDDLENLRKTLEFYKRENIELRNNIMLDIIHEMAWKGLARHVDEMFQYLNPDDVSENFIHITITRFIESGQVQLLPKIFQMLNVDDDKCTQFLRFEMERIQMPADQINEIMETIKIMPKTKPLNGIDNYYNNFDNGLNSTDLHNIRQVNTTTENLMQMTDEKRFHYFLSEKNIIEIELMLSRQNVHMTNSKYARLIELYTEMNNLHKAVDILKQANANDQSFKLNPIIQVKLISLMIRRGRNFNEIKDLLHQHRTDIATHRILPLEILFNNFAKAGNVELLNKLYEAVMENNLVEENVFTTAKLVEVHLVRGDLKQAINVYEQFVKNKNLTPHTFELMRESIERDEKEQLQRIYNIYKNARGESLAQYRLAFAYLECGHEHEARTIFESGKIKDLSTKIIMQCRSLEKLENADMTKMILKTTKNLSCERVRIYRTLLEIYCNNKRVDDAIELWREFNEEDPIKANDDFAYRLIRFLRYNKHSLPSELALLTKKKK